MSYFQLKISPDPLSPSPLSLYVLPRSPPLSTSIIFPSSFPIFTIACFMPHTLPLFLTIWKKVFQYWNTLYFFKLYLLSLSPNFALTLFHPISSNLALLNLPYSTFTLSFFLILHTILLFVHTYLSFPTFFLSSLKSFFLSHLCHLFLCFELLLLYLPLPPFIL